MNQKRIFIKDKYLKAKALSFVSEYNIKDFKSFSGYIDNFKKRYILVSRCHTSSRCLPSNAKSLAFEFLNNVREVIKKHFIKNKNIINFYQVPRYFEQENNKTITKEAQKT
ncbi:hypothetical protein DMUE_0211 [Dictyocoela muelleri]|nr:hypothetical protein DMUE_0211 [Dictyocoela muelleri]